MDNVARAEERLAQRERDVAVSINKNKQEMWIVVTELKEDKFVGVVMVVMLVSI